MTTQERIKADAERLYRGKPDSYFPSNFKYIEGYIAGATAEHHRAQVLVDALEAIERRIKVGKAGASYQIEMIRPVVMKALEQWKGTGKEVAKPAKIETCGHCGTQPANNYIGNQLYLCDECMEKHTEDCY